MQRKATRRGQSEAWWWRGLAGELNHTRALLQATIACVVIVSKAWHPGPESPPEDRCAWGPRLSLPGPFPFFLWLVRCLCSRGEGQSKDERRRKTITTSPCAAALHSSVFSSFCFMFSGQLLVSCARSKNRQRWGIYILANFSHGFLTRKHILQFLSILVFLRLSVAVSLTSTGLLQMIVLLTSPPGPSIFLFSLSSETERLHMSESKDLLSSSPDYPLVQIKLVGPNASPNSFNRTVMSKFPDFPNCAVEMCLMSARDKRGGVERRNTIRCWRKPRLSADSVYFETPA